MTKFEMQVLVKNAEGQDEWKSVRPTGGEPYQYGTAEEASKMLQMCYREATWENRARVMPVEVP